jgi:CheY-like chemotaxis protein
MNYLLVVDDSLVDRQVVGGLLQRKTEHHVEYASNGLEALELLEARLPLAMVTDLQMPEMDGMQLVTTVRRRFPSVPVIVTTAHGSEDIAAQALLAGAADYVPKSEIVTELLKSLENVLAIASGDRLHYRLSHCLRYEELQYELENDLLLVPPLVSHLQEAALDLGLVDATDNVRLGRSLIEALRNAIYHGNLELSPEQIAAVQSLPGPTDAVASRRKQLPYGQRRVYVRALLSPREARFTIRDEGPGYDVASLPDIIEDPTPLSRSGGRGLVLIRMFMDEVRFNTAGNEITLVKRGHTPSGLAV